MGKLGNGTLENKAVEAGDGKRRPENRQVKNVVIGGGMAGLLTAYLLQEQGMEVLVLEAERVAGGQTGRTTAKITAQHGLYYGEMIRKVGVERMRGYAGANADAIRAYEDLIGREHIDCDFKRLPSYLYTVEEAGKKNLQREAEAAGRLGLDARYMSGEWLEELPFPVKGAVCFEKQAQFQPMKFVEAIRGKLEIWEHTRVLDVEDHRVTTTAGILEADNIIFACHYPFLITPGCYFLRQHQERSYVLALRRGGGVGGTTNQKERETCSAPGAANRKVERENDSAPGTANRKVEWENSGLLEMSAMYYGIDKGGLSFRSAGDVLLLGGGAHRTGKKFDCHSATAGEMICGKTGDNDKLSGKGTLYGYDYLREAARRLYPGAIEVAAWSAQDCMPHDRIPLIGRYSILRPYWYVITGFQKWGMSSAMVAATIISEKIGGRESAYEWVFAPQRFLPQAGLGNFCVDAGESLAGLTAGWFGKKKNRCTHMGCGLHGNPEEGTKDCPCHGSRFDENGKLLDGPANRGLPGWDGAKPDEENAGPNIPGMSPGGAHSPWNAL